MAGSLSCVSTRPEGQAIVGYFRDLPPDYPELLRFDAFFGTFFPSARASERPMAMACLRLVTFFPDRPLLSVPALRFFIARSTSAETAFEYFRAISFSRLLGG